MEEPPKAVPVTANQFGYDPLRWAWVEPAVWTERMLTALEQGVKGNRWFSLIDKVYSPRCLIAAAFQVEANEGAAGVDHVSVKTFGDRREAEVAKLSEQLRTGSYRPQAVRRVHIPKPGTKETRPLGPVFQGNKGTVRDRVVQAAVVKVIEPIFERDFAATTAARRCPATAFVLVAALRRRTHRGGRARGREQFRWPNAYFAKQGLFSLVTTPAQVVRSSRR